MTHLALLIHADPRVMTAYRAAISAKVDDAVDFAIVNSPFGAFSSGYRRLFRELRSKAKFGAGGSAPLLSELLSYAKVRPLDHYQSVTLGAFSAGYALVQELLAIPEEAERIAGAAFIDSFHTGFDPQDHTPRDSQMAGLVRHALRAKEGEAVLWFGHTDVRTPQKTFTQNGKTIHAFASTTQVAQELKRLAGVSGQEGCLKIEAFDTRKSDHQEHIQALTGWGPMWLADAVNEVSQLTQERTSVDIAVPDSIPAEPLGERALAIAIEEQRSGVAELPGAKHNPRILEYHAGAERGGKLIGPALRADEIPWCASAASFCAFQVAVRGEQVPHRYRCSVQELWRDAISSGAAVGASRIRRGDYEPRRGDLVIMSRGGPAFGEGASAFAKTRGRGHVGRLKVWNLDGSYVSLDGNVSDAWTDCKRSVGSTSFVGVIAYPRLGELERTVATESELDALRILQANELLEAWWSGSGSIADAAAALRKQYG